MRRSGGFDQAQGKRPDPAVILDAWTAGQMQMRRTIARPSKTRMTAKGDRLALLVAAIRISAVPVTEFGKRDQPRPDPDAAQLDGLGRLTNRRGQAGLRGAAFGGLAWPDIRLLRLRRLELWHALGPGGNTEPHPPGAANHGAARIGGAEPGVDRIRGTRKRQAGRDKFPECRAMVRPPTHRLHERPFPGRTEALPGTAHHPLNLPVFRITCQVLIPIIVIAICQKIPKSRREAAILGKR